MWSQRVVSATAESSVFGNYLDQRYALIAAADVNGFIKETYELAFREDGNDD